jgi:hypothetical protein
LYNPSVGSLLQNTKERIITSLYFSVKYKFFLKESIKMFSSGPNYNKLKTNLRLAVNRLKLLEKKKTETNQKARKEIAGNLLDLMKLAIIIDFDCCILDFLAINKPDRARIRVEHIIREDVSSRFFFCFIKD